MTKPSFFQIFIVIGYEFVVRRFYCKALTVHPNRHRHHKDITSRRSFLLKYSLTKRGCRIFRVWNRFIQSNSSKNISGGILLKFIIQINILCFLAISPAFSAEAGQFATISGFIYDQSDGEGMIGANAFLEGTTIGGSSNISGYYVIPHIPVGKFTLVIHYIGYKKHKEEVSLSVGENKVVNVRLEMESIRMQDVVVTDKSIPESEKLFEKSVSNLQLSARQIRQIPQVAEADLLRSLQTLPGILPLSDFSSALYVRGGTPDQNLNLLDGVDVYNPEHAFGLFSTFNTEAIKQVELSKGGFNAKYGGRLSSILDVTNLDGNRESFEATGSISLLSVKTTIQMPIASMGSLSGSVRRTYFDKTIGKALEDIPNYYFYDGNLKAFFDINSKNKLTLSGYGSQDVFDLEFNQKSSDSDGLVYNWGNKTGSARWTHVFSPQLFGNIWFTASRFDSDFEFKKAIDVSESNFVSDYTIKGDFEYHTSEKFVSRFGLEHKFMHLIFSQTAPDAIINVETTPTISAAYVSGNWRPNLRWDIEPGLRFNRFGGKKIYSNWAPRFSAKYRLTDSINLKTAAGLYYQYLHRIPRAFIADIWVASNEEQRESSSAHLIAGISKNLADDYQVELEVYYKNYRNIYSFNQNVVVDIEPDRPVQGKPVYTSVKGVFNRGDGDSRGIELHLRKDYGSVTGWIGYSLAMTNYVVDGVNRGNEFSPRHDRAHTINCIANIDWKNFRRALRGESPIAQQSNWKIGVAFVYRSGQPITLPGSGYYINALPDWEADFYALYPSKINELRLPDYLRLDLSLTYEKHFESWSLFPYIQVFNIGNRKNIWFLEYTSDFVPGDPGSRDDDRNVATIDTKGMFPILPTIGLNFTFK